jgi:hypothetical protein
MVTKLGDLTVSQMKIEISIKNRILINIPKSNHPNLSEKSVPELHQSDADPLHCFLRIAFFLREIHSKKNGNLLGPGGELRRTAPGLSAHSTSTQTYPHYQIPPLVEYRLQLQKLKKTEPELFKHAVGPT